MRRLAIVSGGTKGLGRALSMGAVARGYEVIAVFSKDQSSAAELQELAGPDLKTLKADIACDHLNFDVVAPAEILLLNNASAAFEPTPFHLITDNEFARIWEVTAKGSFRLAQAVSRVMVRSRTGTIVNVLTRVLQGEPPPGFVAYGAAKGALAALTAGLATELYPRGIKVFSVSPGYMETPLTAAWNQSFRDAATRAGPPTKLEEVAARILDLATSPKTVGKGEDHQV